MNAFVHPARLIALDAVHNFRDLGGYPTADGRTTRWRTLFRADGLYRLTSADLEIVDGLGLRTVVDLRTEEELELRGRFPVEYRPIRYLHVPVIDVTWAALPEAEVTDRDPAEFLEWAYLDMLRQAPDRFARAFEHLCEPGVLPAVFHCAAGKDRTGLLSMLVLGALGVPDDVIVDDYALTADAVTRLREWARRESPDLYERLEAAPPAYIAAVPEAMHRVLGVINERHGSVRGLVDHLGVRRESIDHLSSALLE
ncbi:MAG: tyrosine-protein phosphatase [Ilumatobacteraceae bacterium]